MARSLSIFTFTVAVLASCVSSTPATPIQHASANRFDGLEDNYMSFLDVAPPPPNPGALPVPDRPLNKGPVGKPSPDTDPLWIWKDCYNNNNIPEKVVGKQSLCTTLVENFGTKKIKHEKEFREACDLLLGPFCIAECRHVAQLYDSPTYNPDPEDSPPEYLYPLGFNNKVRDYYLSTKDCAACIDLNRCFPYEVVPEQTYWNDR